MIGFAPLLAQGFDLDAIIGIVMVILFFILPAVLKLLGKGQAQQQGKKPARPARPAPQAGGGGVDDEIEDFLRRAAGHRGGKPDPRGGEPQPIPAQRAAQPQRPRPQRPAGARLPRPRPAMAEVVEPVAVPAEVVEEWRMGAELTQHVDEHLDSSDIRRHSASLGGEVARTDARVGERLREKFDHAMGQFDSSSSVASVAESQGPPSIDVAALSTGALGLPALFARAESIRQAIVVSEILQRPEDRWS